jgi:hypothetical protein
MLCRSCEKPLRGRIDKKFCDDGCRNHYNNRYRTVDLKLARRVNSILYKNRRVLKELYTARKFRVKKATLSQLGYAFEYHTQRCLVGRRAGWLCYDFGILPLRSGGFRIIYHERRK